MSCILSVCTHVCVRVCVRVHLRVYACVPPPTQPLRDPRRAEAAGGRGARPGHRGSAGRGAQPRLQEHGGRPEPLRRLGRRLLPRAAPRTPQPLGQPALQLLQVRLFNYWGNPGVGVPGLGVQGLQGVQGVEGVQGVRGCARCARCSGCLPFSRKVSGFRSPTSAVDLCWRCPEATCTSPRDPTLQDSRLRGPQKRLLNDRTVSGKLR